ncbi:MAG TPA: hypothetical protein VFQ16_01520 [Burkholderiaceae bacterium]|nr:hypothetical protein [Burkholderiaceae bacterium]
MPKNAAATILDHLSVVEGERACRVADPSLGDKVLALKHYQQRRFERTYADLLAHPRYARASRFFLDELYGPVDFTRRDAQFARVVPGMVRLFPDDVITTVETLGALHALSEQFDTAMARQLAGPIVTAADYARAWKACGDREARTRQIDLLLRVGRALDAFTRIPWLHRSLRMMRLPARAAGLDALQAFLESGFETFRAMHGAEEFLTLIETRERALADALFQEQSSDSGWLGQLP